MEAFSYQHQNHHQSLFLDPAYIPPTCNSTINVAPAPHQPVDLTNVSSSCTSPIFFNCYYSPDQPITEVSDNDLMTTHDSSSSPDIANQVVVGEEVQTKHNDCSVEKKRKNSKQMVVSSSNPVLSHDLKEGKRRKQKKCSNGVLKNADEEKQQQRPPPPTGYIHVRARRGQATDSHSLAERVRREKISERMKLLQGLVPGCDKVIGKALMLDEIINYVQSLQNQVEFLSMKLASVSPNMYEFGMNLDDYFIQDQKIENLSASVPLVENRTGQIQATAFVGTTDNYSMVDTSVPFVLHGQGPTVAYSQEQVTFAIQVDGQQRFLQELQLNNN